MKKTLVFLFAVLLVVAFTVPASAFESQFGGLWRTRWYVQQNFTGNDTIKYVPSGSAKSAVNPSTGAIEATRGGTFSNVNVIDTRTRLFYTAVFSDNFRFVNQFEFNVTWGDASGASTGDGGGGIGTDGRGTFRIKRSFVDFRLASTRWTVGLQGQVLARGFLFDDDFAGAILRYQPGTTADLLVPFMWAKSVEGFENKAVVGTPATDSTGTNDDQNIFAIYPFFPVGNMVINPYGVYLHNNLGKDNDLWWLGVDLDFKFSAWSLWLSGIYNGGDVSATVSKESAYLLGGGFNVPLGGFGVHGEIWYATGDDGSDATKDKSFSGLPGQSYYWSEIMGLGMFDNQASFGAPGNKISNILAGNLGIDWNPSDLWKLKADLWYAQLAEDNAVGETSLGTELDVVLTYKLVENMNLDLVGAYLFSGKATDAGGGLVGKESDPYEIGLRMQFTF